MDRCKYELNLMVDPQLPFRIGYNLLAFQNPWLNWHENVEIVYIISGNGHVRYNETTFPIAPGDIIVFNSETIHCVYSDTPLRHHFLTVDRNFCAECGIPSTALVFQSLVRDPKMQDRFLKIIDAYDRYTQTGVFYEVAAVRSCLLDFLCCLCRDYLIQENSSNLQRNDALKTAVTYIREHLSEPMSLEEIAQHTGISANTLLRKFKKVMGRSVFDTILLLRCTQAKRLLEQGCSVTEAARTSGFENMSYFTRIFKRYYQCTPSSYLQNKQATHKEEPPLPPSS